MNKIQDFFDKEMKEKLGVKEQPTVEKPEGEQPKVEQPKVEQPKDEEPKVEETKDEEPKDDNPIEKFDKFAKDMGYENMEAFINSTAADKIKNFDGIKAEYDKAKKENEELYSSYEKTQNPFVDDRVYKINKLLSDNEGMSIEVASKIATGGFDDMSNYEILMMQEKLDSPELTDKLIKRNIERKYGIEDWDDLDEDTKDYMEIDARKAKSRLSKMSNIEVPEKIVPDNVREKIKQKEEEANRSIEEVQKEWNPLLDQFDDAFKEMPIPAEIKGKIEVVSNYVFSDKDKQELKSQVDNYIKTKKIRPTEENIKKINRMVYDNTILDRLPKLVGIAMDKAVNDYKESLTKEKYNPSQPKGKTPDKGVGKKPLSEVFKKLNE